MHSRSPWATHMPLGAPVHNSELKFNESVATCRQFFFFFCWFIHTMTVFIFSIYSTFCSSHYCHICTCAWHNSRPRTEGGGGNDSSGRLSGMHQNLCQQWKFISFGIFLLQCIKLLMKCAIIWCSRIFSTSWEGVVRHAYACAQIY